MDLSWNKLSSDQQSAAASIIAVAKSKGVNARTALASAFHESGFNRSAVGDNGSSYGIFQLHRGGELGNLSPQQAFDPTTNANVALGVFASNASKFSDPGQLAAASQRPANPTAYAVAVDNLYNDPSWLTDIPSNLQVPAPGIGTSPSAPTQNDATLQNTGVASDVVNSLLDPIKQYWVRAFLIIGGFVLVVIALHGLTSSSATPVGVVGDGAQAAGQNVKKGVQRASGAAATVAE